MNTRLLAKTLRLIRSYSSQSGRKVELRSDTLTAPCNGMRQAMYQAEVGDDVYQEDETVKSLERVVAGLLGKEAGLFVASGTMGNLISLSVHCQRGDEIILGSRQHIFEYEGGGASAHLGVAYHTIPNQKDGTLDLQDIKDAIRIDDVHYPRTRLVALENTHNKTGGTPLTAEYMNKVGELCKEESLILHVDGARLMNASVALDTPARELVNSADSVSLCLSKGLGAPIGSVIVGSKDFVHKARRVRKSLGGGWRQAGILASAGLYALKNNIGRLALDHDNAKLLATGLAEIPGILADPESCQTNIVYFGVECMSPHVLRERLHQQYGIFLGNPYRGKSLRAVTSLMVSREDIEYTIESIRKVVRTTGQIISF